MRQPDNAKSPMSVYFLSLFRSIMLYVLQMGLHRTDLRPESSFKA